jgi:hypothetical protein
MTLAERAARAHSLRTVQEWDLSKLTDEQSKNRAPNERGQQQEMRAAINAEGEPSLAAQLRISLPAPVRQQTARNPINMPA